MNNFKLVLIYGYSISGKAVEKVLLKCNINYQIFDDKLGLSGGKYVGRLTKKQIAKFDLIVVSPGVSVFNKKLQYAKNLNISVISELEFGFLNCPYPIIAVTGTNGKTTTTKLIEHTLNLCGYNTKALGNVGEPLSQVINYNKLDFVICEVSSFQLELVSKFKPYIGVILNVFADHIDRHKTFENYLNCKLKLFSNCDLSTNLVVCNQSNVLSALNSILKPIVLNQDVKVKNKVAFYFDEELFEINGFDFKFKTNYLAAIAVLKIIGIKNNQIKKHLFSFKELGHRLEFVDTINKVDFINDSKATNVHATLSALSCFKSSVTLLLGGSGKKENFKELKNNLKNVKHVIAFGKCKHKIFNALKKVVLVQRCTTLTEAFNLAIKTDSKTILLSPACASFDQFKSYEQRGELFRELVKNYKGKVGVC